VLQAFYNIGSSKWIVLWIVSTLDFSLWSFFTFFTTALLFFYELLGMWRRNFPESQDSLVCSFSILKRTKLVDLFCCDYLNSTVEDAEYFLLLQLSYFNNWNFNLWITQINGKYFLFYSQKIRRKTNEGFCYVHSSLHQIRLRQSTAEIIIYIFLY
jgi:hypothetical protein